MRRRNTPAAVTLRIALGHGDGTFETPTSTAIRGGFNYHISTADMDGDAVPDIMLASSSALEFLRGVGDGSFETSVSVALGRILHEFSSSFAIGDFDGDGNQDVAAVDGVNLNIFSGRGDGTFDAPLQIACAPEFRRRGRRFQWRWPAGPGNYRDRFQQTSVACGSSSMMEQGVLPAASPMKESRSPPASSLEISTATATSISPLRETLRRHQRPARHR